MATPRTSPFLDFYDIDDLLTDEQRLVTTSVRDFVSRELQPGIGQAYLEERFLTDKIKSFGELGLLGGNLKGYGLAGMDQISVEVGQFVLAGEPVGSMGEGNAAPPATDGDRGDPVLYVEFKKDGGSIDPEPWWARSPSEKVRG